VNDTSDRLLRRRDAAEYLHTKYGFTTERTLAKLAVTGGGPAFRKAGRLPVYAIPDLDAWATGKLSPLVRSTSEYEAA
jgi:hypothetical protein